MRSKVLSTLGMSVLALGLATTGLVGTASAAAPAPSASAAGATATGSISVGSPDAKTCAANDNAWNSDGVTAQDFGSSAPELNTEGAADFSIAKKKCKVGSVELTGYPGLGGVADSATVWIYKDDGGLPGKEKCTATEDGAGPDFVVSVSKCKLKKGDYWLAAQVSQDFATQGQWFWATTSDIKGEADLWRNPGGGFGTSCNDNWGTISQCIGLAYDYLFVINKK